MAVPIGGLEGKVGDDCGIHIHVGSAGDET